jgi:hypothetical protein
LSEFVAFTTHFPNWARWLTSIRIDKNALTESMESFVRVGADIAAPSIDKAIIGPSSAK